MFEQTVFVDEIDNEDVENYIIKAFTDRDDIARISSVKTERGTSYPFARTFSFELQLTF